MGNEVARNHHSTVPNDCIERVITQHGEMTIYQRSSTPRLAPRIVLKSAWSEQQQLQQWQDVLSQRSRGKLQAIQCRWSRGNCTQDSVQNRVQNPETHPQVWKGDNQSQMSGEKLQHCVHDRVTHEGRSCGKLQAGHCPRQHA